MPLSSKRRAASGQAARSAGVEEKEKEKEKESLSPFPSRFFS